jgi:hypothetical protein
MWSGSVFNIRDGHDIMNVVFQCKHLNRIIISLQMSGFLKELHWKYEDNFIMSAIQTIGMFLFNGETMKVEW